jgi:hypothetical protein
MNSTKTKGDYRCSGRVVVPVLLMTPVVLLFNEANIKWTILILSEYTKCLLPFVLKTPALLTYLIC